MLLDCTRTQLRAELALRDRGRRRDGEVLDLSGQNWLGLSVTAVSQEHGVIAGGKDRLPVGTRVRVVPSHACMTAAAHAGYWLVDQAQCLGWLARVNGWRWRR